ncbi:hypothetical protein [Vibrio sp. Vb0304]|uniref:hypothetical protein n=1 Tax=Vibrio sp. Vb0304 TaxID=3074623 RepID=UPI002964BF48|nr:hypothetical protein [Vibrio sp. Vb0304]MDW1981953.1 hypothetical protein [Vibrio sp. Vb0304]
MTQNIEERTQVAVTRYEGAAKSVDEIAHKDTDVVTPVGSRKSFPKISREWDEKSTELKTQWENDSATLREDWHNERNELSIKALGVKPWESGVTETNINQQRRWTDNHTYLPKSVPVVMDVNGPNEDWIAFTADKSGILSDIYGRKPIDLIEGLVIVPNTNEQYPKLFAFGKVWDLSDGSEQITIKSFVETSDGHLLITLIDDSQVVADSAIGATRPWVEKQAKIKAESTLTPRPLPDRFAHEIDVRDFGAHDLALNNLEAFQKAFDKARELDKPVVAKGHFALRNGLLKLYTSADFSGATFYFDNAAIEALDSREDGEYIRVLTEVDFSKALMKEGRGSLRGIVPDAILDDYVNSYVRISSQTIHQYRILGGVASPYKQSSVSILRRYGQLDYTLTHDFSASEAVTIEFRKLPKSKLEIKAPKIELINHTYQAIWYLKRSLSHFVSPCLMTDRRDFIASEGYRSLFNVSLCANVVIDNMDTVGLGDPLNIEDVEKQVSYDLSYNHVVGLEVNNPNCGTGWKSIDGNYSRGLKVKGGTISGMHGHFGVSDVTVDDVTVTASDFSFGTGAIDSTIKLTNIKYNGTYNRLLSLRSDFAELKGKVVVDDVSINANKVGDKTFNIIDLYEQAVRDSGGVNPLQPRTLYLPRTIEVRNLSIDHDYDVELVNILDHEYQVDQPLKMPRRIKFSDIDITGVKGMTRLKFDAKPFDRSTSNPIILDLRDFVQRRKEQPVILKIGQLGESIGMAFDLRLSNMEISTHFYDGKFGHIGNNYRSRVVATHSRIYRGWDMFDGTLGSGKLMHLEWNSCTYNPIDLVGHGAFSLGYGVADAKIMSCTFNGSEYLASEGTLPEMQQLVSQQSNNTFIDYDVPQSIKDGNKFGHVRSDGKMYLLGACVGHKGNFTRDASGMLSPTWDVNREIMMLGKHWIWFDDSGAMRVHSNYPADFNMDGQKVAFA